MKEEGSQSLNFSSLAAQTEGYSAADLNDLVSRAFHQAAIRISRSFRNAPSAEVSLRGPVNHSAFDWIIQASIR